MIHLLFPYALLLLPLPLVVHRYFRPAPLPIDGALRAPFFRSLAHRQSSASDSHRFKRPWRWTLMTAIWLCLISALARPAILGEQITLPVESRNVMFAIDLSGSMAREDFALDGRISNRLSVIKAAADDFIERRVGDRVGLVLFSDRAYVQAPLTLDRSVVRQLLDEARVGLTGQETAIGDAIGIAVKRLKDRPAQSRVLILMTDGASNTGTLQPLQAAQFAKELGIRIHTIGVGADQMTVDTRLGRRIVNPSEDLDEKTLAEIAELTGGHSFRATDTQGLAQVYQQLDELEPVADKPVYVQPSVSLFQWPLGLAAFLCALLCLTLQPPALKPHFSLSSLRGPTQ